MTETEVIEINLDKRHLQAKIIGRSITNIYRYRRNLSVLCLPGKLGWDIDFFKGYSGIGHITGLEEDVAIAGRLQERFFKDESVTILNLKTTEFLFTTKKTFDVIYLDYFSALNSVVRTDIEIMFSRKLLNPMGRIIVNLYGSREDVGNQIKNKMIYEEACKIYKTKPRDFGEAVQRCRNFNAYVMIQKRKAKVATSVPIWSRYRSGSVYMYTGIFAVNNYLKGSKTFTGAESKNLRQWFLLEGEDNIETVQATSLQSYCFMLERRGMRPQKERFYINKIKAFYDENHYTPSVRELFGTQRVIKNWTKLVRMAGLCPRVFSTEKDLVLELKRIHKRDGFVSEESLLKAKILRKLGWAKQFKSLCERYDLTFHNAIAKAKKDAENETLKTNLSNYLSFIDAGGHKTNFPWYQYINRRRLSRYEAAAKKLRALSGF